MPFAMLPLYLPSLRRWASQPRPSAPACKHSRRASAYSSCSGTAIDSLRANSGVRSGLRRMPAAEHPFLVAE